MKKWAVVYNGRFIERHWTEGKARRRARRLNRGLRYYDVFYSHVRLP